MNVYINPLIHATWQMQTVQIQMVRTNVHALMAILEMASLVQVNISRQLRKIEEK